MSSEPLAPTALAGPRLRTRLKPLGAAAVKLCRKALAKGGPAYADLLAAWPEIVGPALAPHCLPLALNRASRTLTLRTVAARALEIQHRERELVDRIATYCGPGAVQRVKIVQGPLPDRQKRRPAPAPRSLSADEQGRIRKCTAGLSNERLRAAMTRLGERIAESERPPGSGQEP